MKTKPWAGLALALAAAGGLAGCGSSSGVTVDNASCANTGRVDNPVLVLMAQAVPTAQLVPCIASVPAGWSRSRLHVGTGSVRFALGSMAQSHREISVALTRSCNTAGATRVPSEVVGARRYERPERVDAGYLGKRYYVFAGGCATYEFAIPAGVVRAAALSEAAGAIRFATRPAIADLVARMNDGRVPLDPPARRAS